MMLYDAAIECDDYLIAVLVNRVEYKKHKKGVSGVKCHSVYALYFSKIASRNWFPWNVIDSWGTNHNCRKEQNLLPTLRYAEC